MPLDDATSSPDRLFSRSVNRCARVGAKAAGNFAGAPAVLQKLVDAAVERTHHIVRYDPAYVRIPYPNGDVPANTGVCTDEIIRVYRAVGIDSVDPIQRVTGFIPTATYSFSEAAT